ncbi:MAG: prepilin-type N-terminal cleavage/methylation domain-containing protein [Deltaproteobacteria bacterium]|nr:prepilin-type N-terminal cleavage/methylation domain-containing protein [Deltaproteobacteria bacterium]
MCLPNLFVCPTHVFAQPLNKTTMKKGFSLIELLVVLVLISVFSAFVGVNVAGSLGNMELKTASKKVAASLRYARSRAITESVPYVALLDLNQNRVTVKPNPMSPGSEEDTGESASKLKESGAKHYDLPKDVKFKNALTFDGAESDSRFFAVVFMPNGCSSGGTILLENNRERGSTVTIDFVTGTVRVEIS